MTPPPPPPPRGGPVSPFPICCLPHPQGLWVFSFWRTGEIKKRFASWVGSTRAFFSPRQEPVMLVGDSGVGKTCLLVRFKDGAFLAGTFISTVGIDFRNKVLDVDGMKVKLQIWDTAGQERFRSVTHAYYRDAHALLLLYDVTNKASFDNIQAWLTEIQDYAQHDVVLMLLGNKVDSAQERVVKREDGEKLAKEYGLPFMETSAKTGLNVDLAFTAVAKELKQRSMKVPSEPRFRLHDYVKREGRGASCCRP
ncbi:ras-related protein Rab-26 isoform X2 [Prionailurus viverrinus]|uniref:ras-related protein Rab-26 isoform X2 n=1 Tax=Prionailurus viverrinus TaxID=61388 RepID=UPI001FF46092|nr:ras-related protein Rab-26 isoform X2 [Prionailurus viverrinus]